MILVVGVLSCLSAAEAIATCSFPTSALNYPFQFNVTNYNATTSSPYTESREIFKCSPAVYSRVVFNGSQGQLSSQSPFMVVFEQSQSNLTAETQTWLGQNLEISFKFLDGAVGAKVVDVTNNSSDFPILPGSPPGPTQVIGGIEYFKGRSGAGINGFGLSLYQLTTTLKFTSSPSSDVITELNNKPVRIKLGDLKINTRDYNANNLSSTTLPIYVDLQLKIKIPTCTMRDVNVDLGKTTLAQLKSAGVANLTAFDVEFRCDAIASKSIHSRITDAFNISNVNGQGILFNHPTSANAAQDVGVRLLDKNDKPLMIGSRAPFIPTDLSAAPTYRKTLKAQLYKTGQNPTLGYVNAQATVLLDYE